MGAGLGWVLGAGMDFDTTGGGYKERGSVRCGAEEGCWGEEV